ncbi:YbaB/EbfC family nucleoid-associated protein [Polaribacter vadi]|uniref:YbaB/EbfC family nucleoid-associated protein n=1 Tax=Polaribacter TaxID=52959 RepID=UPI001C092F79|nr:MULTISPECIES: YbaB/EbfC family nucleoid-associated protein [Polaribacter]MBU3011949.1 YbaB/EbfC family nucleoid-associated protein [Polaribacter vadi]MDO6741764.1 YbaB/EbfC family nucleoid-associated protein [Polaribacter sp. 1_MG-2023]
MFGDLSGMMDKLKKAQEEVEKTKVRLDSVLIDETSADGKIKVTLTANRNIKSIAIDDSLLSDAEELEDFLIITLNKAIEKASKINETEMAAAAKSGMPNIPGMR